MKIGVSSYSFLTYMRNTQCGLKEVCRIAKEIGFEVIDFTDHEPTHGDLGAQAEELRAYCDEIGLEIGAITVGTNFVTDENAVADMCRYVDVAVKLGVKVMRFDVCGWLPPEADWKEAVEKIAPKIREVSSYAAKKGIRTCSENHGMVFQEPERMKYLLSTVNDDNYGWLVDIGNFLCRDVDPATAVSEAVPYIVRAHVKDFLYRKAADYDFLPEGAIVITSGGNWLRGTILGHGDVAVAECVKTLRKAGYEDTFTLEFEGPEDNLTALKHSCSYMKKLAAMPLN